MRRILLAVPAVLALAAIVRKLLSKRGGSAADLPVTDRGPREDAGAPPSDAPATESVEDEFTCECGAKYRVSGEGRHRVFWKADASISDPILDGRCAECGNALPGQHPHEASDEEGGGETSSGDEPQTSSGDEPQTSPGDDLQTSPGDEPQTSPGDEAEARPA